jgi:hypothetical protein
VFGVVKAAASSALGESILAPQFAAGVGTGLHRDHRNHRLHRCYWGRSGATDYKEALAVIVKPPALVK